MAPFQSIKVKLPDSLLSSESCTAACHQAPQTPDLYCLAHTEGCHKPTWEGGRVPDQKYWSQQGQYAHQLTEIAVPWETPISLQYIYQIVKAKLNEIKWHRYKVLH